HGLVGLSLRAGRDDLRPGQAEVDGTREHDEAAIIFEQRRIHGAAVYGINHNLRIELCGAPVGETTWGPPGGPVITARDPHHARDGTGSAARNADVLRIKNVNVAVAVGCDGGLPLVAFLHAD